MNMIGLYERLGGDVFLQVFVNHLYRYMDDIVKVEHVRNMHPSNLGYANDRLFKFLSGMLGGPSLYMDEFGPPRLRQRHMPFSISNNERD